MNPVYSIERVTKNRLVDVQFLYKAAFNKDVDIPFLTNKFSTEVFGSSYVGYIAYAENGEPAAFYGVFPCMVEFGNETYLSAQSGDTMTHPTHQGKGLFTALALKTYELCREEGIHLVFGFPNQNSYPGFVKKLGWSHFDDLQAYEIRVRCLPWIRIKNTFKLPQSIHNKWCAFIFSLLRNGQPFHSSLKNGSHAVIDHSADFFTYKRYSDSKVKQIGRHTVWFKHDDLFLILGDMNCSSESEFLNVVKRMKRIAFLCGLPHLRMHCSTGTEMDKWFKKYGNPLEATYPVGGINFSNEIPLELLKFTTADNDTF
jgi:GNAT superfamily N-acetyltransferase